MFGRFEIFGEWLPEREHSRNLVAGVYPFTVLLRDYIEPFHSSKGIEYDRLLKIKKNLGKDGAVYLDQRPSFKLYFSGQTLVGATRKYFDGADVKYDECHIDAAP